MEQFIHLLTDLLAGLVGMFLYLRSKTDDTLDNDQRWHVLVGALVGALIGSRLVAALEDPALFMEAGTLLYYFGGKTIIGGIAGGIIGIEIVKKILGVSVWTGDRTLVPLAVAILIGRIGCFVAGVDDGTVGGACSYLWCLEQGDGVLRHPNSLYEISFLLLFLTGYWFARRLRPAALLPFLERPGASFRVFIVSYFFLRFFIEFLKDTHPLLLGMNSVQLVCLGFALWYIEDLIAVYRMGRQAT